MSCKLGIDIGGSFVKMGVVENGRLIKKESLEIKKIRANLISGLSGAVSSLTGKFEINGIGIACAGLIDKKGIVRYSPNLPELNGLNLKSIMQKKLGKKVRAANDVNAQALGEKKFGAGKKFRHFAFIAIGSGVGGAIVANGKIYPGAHGFAGEFGHMKLAEKGEKCNCGASGCLESFVGASYVVRRASSKIKGRNLSMKLIAELAKKGDKEAIKIFSEMGKYLGTAIANIANALDVEAVIVGGGVSNAGNILFGPARKEFRKNALPVIRDEVKILPSKLGEYAGVIGASLLV